MTKTELISKVAEKSGISKKNTEMILNAALDSISDSLAECETVKLHGFGVFEIKENAKRVRRNPQTNEAVVVEANRIPKFRPGQLLKDKVKD